RPDPDLRLHQHDRRRVRPVTDRRVTREWIWKRLGAPTDQGGSVNDPRPRDEHGVRWKQKGSYPRDDGPRVAPALPPKRPRPPPTATRPRSRCGTDRDRAAAASLRPGAAPRRALHARGGADPQPEAACRLRALGALPAGRAHLRGPARALPRRRRGRGGGLLR